MTLLRSYIGIALVCLLTTSLAAVADGSLLLDKSRESRLSAEQELADFSRTQLVQRTELAGKIQAAYARMTAAEKKMRAVRRELADLKQNRDEFRRNESSYKFKYSVLREELIASGWKTFSDKPAAELIADEVWRGISAAITELDFAQKVYTSRQKVVTRDGRSEVLTVLHFGSVAAYACGDDRDTSGILVSLPEGGMRISGQTMEAFLRDELALAPENGNTVIPADVTGNLSTREDQPQGTFGKWLQSGGLFVYPIIICGVLGLVLVVERVLYLARTSPSAGDFAAMRKNISSGQSESDVSASFCAYPEWHLAENGIQNKNEDTAERESRMESALLLEVPALNRSLSFLSALAGVAPLLGLLGTVSGMIHTFADIASFGTGNSRILSGGISEALITTQLGLMVAVPLLLCHAWLSRSIERREVLLEQWGMDVLHIISEQENGDANADV